MTRATVSRLVEDLWRGGVLDELDPAAERRRGRPGTPLVRSGARFVALGLQVDVGYLAAVVVDLPAGSWPSGSCRATSRGSAPRPCFARVARLARQGAGRVPAGGPSSGRGLALPGIVVDRPGTLLRAPNLGWSDVASAVLLDPPSLGGSRLAVGNEADLAAATVSLSGPGRPGPVTDFLYLSGEIGIGGAVVFDGRPVAGRHGWAGEVGHVTVDPDGPGLRVRVDRVPRAVCRHAGPARGRRVSRTTRAEDLEERVRADDDDPPAAAVERAARALGVALSTVVNVLDVPVVVLGGHLRELADLLGPRSRRSLADGCSPRDWVAADGAWRRSRTPRPVPSARHTVSSNASSTTRRVARQSSAPVRELIVPAGHVQPSSTVWWTDGRRTGGSLRVGSGSNLNASQRSRPYL